MSARIATVARVIGVNIGLLAIALLLLELIFGAWFSTTALSPVRIIRDARIVYDASGYNPEGGSFEYRRDHYGLRGTYKSAGTIDILAVGGSTTNELYVGEGQTWTDVLAATFHANGRAVEVVDAGVDGQSTIGHLHNFDDWFPTIPGLKARYVLAYIGINDVHVQAQAQYDDVAVLSGWGRVQRVVNDRSALYRFHRAIRGMLGARQARVLHADVNWAGLSWQEVPVPTQDIVVDAGQQLNIDAYSKRVETLIERIRDFGAQPIVVTQHRGTYRRNGERLWVLEAVGLNDFIAQSRFNRRAMEVCRSQAAICIDSGAEIEFQPGDFQDYAHTTPQGSKRVAEFLYSRLKDIVR